MEYRWEWTEIFILTSELNGGEENVQFHASGAVLPEMMFNNIING
jgi:hypothetical protein